MTSSGSQSAEATGYNEIGNLYQWRGKTFREGRKGSGVSNTHSLDDIQEYMSECPMNTTRPRFVDEVPFESVEDWVTTIRQACIAPGAAFHWPSEKLSFQRALAVALAHLPPGCFLTIRSAKPLPRRLKSTSNPSGLGHSVQELYHGTSVHKPGLEQDVIHFRSTSASRWRAPMLRRLGQWPPTIPWRLPAAPIQQTRMASQADH